MYIGVLSDTHGNTLAAHAAAHIFQTFSVGRVIHCGDIGTPGVLSALEQFELHFVLGNCDAHGSGLEELGHTCYGRFGSVTWNDTKIAFLHGDNELKLRNTCQSGEFDLVCHGHTHLHNIASYDGTTILNPGALSRTSQPSVAVVNLPALEIVRVSV